MAEFKFVSSRHALDTAVFSLREDRAEHPSGATLARHVVVNRPAVVVVPRRANGDVLLIRQYRLPVRDRLWELPAGRLNDGETPLEAGPRELQEETGCRAGRWTLLTEFFPAPGFATETMTALLAEEIEEGPASPEPYEVIETKWLSWQAALAMIRQGEIRDGKTIAAVLYVEAFRPAHDQP